MIMNVSIDQSELEFDQIEQGRAFTRLLKRGSWAALLVAALFQMIFYPTLINAIVICAVAFAWFTFTSIFLRQEILRNYTLSTFLIFGFSSTQFLFPLLFSSLENKPVTYNLEYPELVFLHSLLTLFVLVIAHAIYRSLSHISYNRSFSLMGKVGFYTPPSDLQLWMMGLIGLASTYYAYFLSPEVGRSVTGDPIDKLIQGLMPFSYAPYFILCGELYGRKGRSATHSMLTLSAFTLALFALSIGRSSTGAFMFGFTSLAFSYLVGSLLGIFTPKFFTFRNLILGMAGIYLLVGPLADLRTAMVIVRDEKTDITAEQLIKRTFETFDDKEALRSRERADRGEELIDFDWDERYLDNVFTARFANVKFNDLSLERAQWIGEYNPDMQEFAYSYLIGILPDPIIRFFNFDVDKEIAYGMSTGDFLYMTAGGYGATGGYRVGHFSGTGMATFGWWYLAILGVGMMPIFFLFDKFQQKKLVGGEPGTNSTHKIIKFSLCGLLAMTTIFQFLPNESIIQVGTYIIRGWIQLAILYLVIFHLTRAVTAFSVKRFRWGTS